MFAVISQCCISNGVARALDIVSTDQPSHCVVPITAENWPRGIETRGANHALICAHDLPFDRRDVTLKAETFTALYRGSEFFSISCSGEKAVLKILDIDQASKVYDGLPKKLFSSLSLFDPAAYKAGLERDRRNNEVQKEIERGKQKAIEESKKGPLDRFLEHPNLASRDKMIDG